MKIYDCQQNTKEWLECKKLHFTASNASTILARGQGLKTLIHKLLTDYYSSGNYEEFTDSFTNKHLERGKEFEDKARKIYELETGQEVKQVGFIESGEHVGCSPDGLVGDDGLVEFKCLSDKVYLEFVETGKISKPHYNQIQMQLWVTGRSWCDYFVVNFNFDPCYQSYRIYPDEQVFIELNAAIKQATNTLLARKEILDKLLTKG